MKSVSTIQQLPPYKKIKNATDGATAHAAHQELINAEKNRPTTYGHGGTIKRASTQHAHYFGFNIVSAANTLLKKRLRELNSVLLIQPQQPLVNDQPLGIMLDTQPQHANSSITLDPELLQMVTTCPMQLVTDPVIEALIQSKLAELADKYQAGDPLLYAAALKNTLTRIHETNQHLSVEQLREFRANNRAEFCQWLKTLPTEWQCALYLAHGVIEQLVNITGFLRANAQLIELVIEAAIVGEDFDIALMQNLNPNSELAKFARVINGINGQTIATACTNMAHMSIEEKNRAIGNIIGAYLHGNIIAGAIPATLRAVERITNIVAEGRIGQSVEALGQRVTRIIASPEEVIATTAEGISLEAHTNTAAQETVLMREGGQMLGSGIEDIANSANHYHSLLRSFNIAEYDPAIGNLKTLEKAIELFEHTPGALTKDGPLAKAVEFGRKGQIQGNLDTARGAMYELEKAVKLVEKGEVVTSLGQKLIFETSVREFDIITQFKLIECKNIDWSKIVMAEIDKMKMRFGQQAKIAKGLGKVFEVHSNKPIPLDWKSWFIEKGIAFFEG